MGDVNGDFTLNFDDPKVDSRSYAKLSIEDVRMKAGEITTVHVVNASQINVQGLQANLSFAKGVKLVGIESQMMEAGDDNFYQSGNTLKLSLTSKDAPLTT